MGRSELASTVVFAIIRDSSNRATYSATEHFRTASLALKHAAIVMATSPTWCEHLSI